MENLNRLYWNIKSTLILQLFTVYLRYLIGLGFIIAAIGMGKLSGTTWNDSIPLDQLHPIQQFFRVISQSTLYWQFIGWIQIIAGVLLVTQRFAKVGALTFFGIILNIFIITVSYSFKGTPVVTGLMLLATTYLILWDFDSLKYIFIKPSLGNLPKQINLFVANHPFWQVLGIILLVVTIGGMVLKLNTFIVMLSGLATGKLGLLIYIMRFGKGHVSGFQESHKKSIA